MIPKRYPDSRASENRFSSHLLKIPFNGWLVKQFLVAKAKQIAGHVDG